MSVPHPSWATSNLGEIGEVFCGQSVSVPEVNRAGHGAVYVTGPEQWNGRNIEKNKWTEAPRRLVPEGCIFITVKGAGVGKTFPGIAAAIGRDIYAYKPARDLNAEFVHRAIRYRIASLIAEARGDIPGLSRDHLAEYTVALPPLAEQRRIVAKLDALTARLARARAVLERVQQLSERLRERAVTAAFQGFLTEDWRQVASDSPAMSDAELQKCYVDLVHAKRRKPAADIEWRPSIPLPDRWRWVSVDDVVAAADYGTSAKTSGADGSTPILRMGNLQAGEIDWKSLKWLPDDHPDLAGLMLQPGDVLFNRTNSFELVGKTALFRGHDRPVSFASYLIRLRPCGIIPILLVRYLNSVFARQWIERVASQQVGQANVNGSKLKALGIPLPPADEQEAMVRRLDGAFARADRLEAEAARAKKLLDRLEAAILARAFRGELVPQDPADEPASILLDRIRAERAAAPKARRGSRAAAQAET